MGWCSTQIQQLSPVGASPTEAPGRAFDATAALWCSSTLRKQETPAMVPPVPAAQMKASTLPPVCSQISLPVPS